MKGCCDTQRIVVFVLLPQIYFMIFNQFEEMKKSIDNLLFLFTALNDLLENP